MIDPAALGTLVLGVQANAHDDELAARARARSSRSRRRPVPLRLRLVATLRRVAQRLEPAPAA